jgi:serine/threonine protein kinase
MRDPNAPYSTIYVPPVDASGEESRSQSTKSEQATDAFERPSDLPGSESEPKQTAPTAPSERYRVERLLGSGSFGVVSLAWDQLVQRPVAIKRPLRKLTDEAKQAFLQEARHAAKVKHPGIVTVFDVGVEPTGEPFIVYEYLEGDSLKQHLGKALPPLAEVVRLGIALAEALAAAHQKGLTHRDLKPANILIDKEGQPHIVDFGLAVHDSDQEPLRGEVAGTFRYMAPEQLRGDAHLLDGRTDLWALGVILYELLTGKSPFPSTKRDDTQQQILTREPRPPRQWIPELPKQMEDIVLKLLRKPLVERYSSAIDLADDLRKSLTHLERPAQEPVAATRSSTVGSSTTWIYSPALTVLAMGVVTTLSTLFAVAWLGSAGNPRGQPSESSRPTTPRPFTDADFSPGRLVSILTPDRSPAEMLFSSEAKRSWNSLGHLSIESRHPAMLELGETSSLNYSLELRLQPSDWTGNMGMFLGYAPVPGDSELAAATLITIVENPSGKIQLAVKRFELKKGGEQYPTFIEQSKSGSNLHNKPSNGNVTMMAELTDGMLAKLYLQHSETKLTEPLSSDQFPTRGKFGIYSLGGALTVQHGNLRVTP